MALIVQGGSPGTPAHQTSASNATRMRPSTTRITSPVLDVPSRGSRNRGPGSCPIDGDVPSAASSSARATIERGNGRGPAWQLLEDRHQPVQRKAEQLIAPSWPTCAPTTCRRRAPWNARGSRDRGPRGGTRPPHEPFTDQPGHDAGHARGRQPAARGQLGTCRLTSAADVSQHAGAVPVPPIPAGPPSTPLVHDLD
jgi:hypothetical protein